MAEFSGGLADDHHLPVSKELQSVPCLESAYGLISWYRLSDEADAEKGHSARRNICVSGGSSSRVNDMFQQL